jgi:radical SAM protein with 4Fe4S-binding SPASM domain
MKTKHLFTYDIRPGHLFHIPDCPDNVMFDLTWACNYRCSFCYNPHGNSKLGHPPWATTKAILHKLAEWGVREVLYLGGEPTLHPKFDDVIELGSGLGLSQRVVTNASRINEARSQLLAAHNVEVGVSLHSANGAVHNLLSGTGQGFQRATKALALLIDTGVRSFVQYSPTRLDPGGLKHLADFLRDQYGDGIRFVDVNRLLPFGEAAQDKDHTVLDADGWWNVLKTVGELISACWTIRVESVPYCWVHDRAAMEGLRNEIIQAILSSLRPCYMGINQLALDPWGFIKACPGGPSTSLGLLESESNQLWKEHPALVNRRILSFLPQTCIDNESKKICPSFYDCLGGCRSASGQPTPDSDPLGPQAHS